MEHPNNFIRESFELLELDFQEYVNNVNFKDLPIFVFNESKFFLD